MENAWKSAARHWWERMREAERERDELLQKLEELRAELREKGGRVFRIEQKLDEHEYARLRSPELLLAQTNNDTGWYEDFAATCAPIRAMTDEEFGDMSEQPSSIPGELADLAKRIAEADAKHPRDCEDAESLERSAAKLGEARRRLKDAPTWENALLCELAEALEALARGDMEAFADELLDVAAVPSRWRRAVLGKGER